MKRFLKASTILLLSVGTPAIAGDILLLGFDTQTPVQRWTDTGTFIDNFGQGGATGSAFDGAGNFWTVAPGFGSNTIQKYDSTGTAIGSSFTASVNGQWIEDMTYGGGHIWASTFEGHVFELDPTNGNTISSFDSVASFAGVAFDGTYLYTTNGFYSGDDSIEKWSTSGSFLGSISTGYNDGAGIGYSSTDNTFWVGYLGGEVRHFDTTGTLLGGFTAGSAAHDGLEVYAPIPEPETYAMLLAGLGLLGFMARRRKESAV